MTQAFITAPTFDRSRQVGTAMVLPVVVMVLTTWDIFQGNPGWLSLLRVLILCVAHYGLNKLRPFMDDLAFVKLNYEVSSHYEKETYFSSRYGALIG